MYIPQNITIAIVLLFVSMFAWGSWANTQKLASKEWRFELFYYDFSIGVLLFSILFAFTLGSFGPSGRGFIQDLAQADLESIGYAFFSAAIWNLGTLLLVAAISLAGMAVAIPLGVGIAWVLGIINSYIFQPQANPTMLLIGGGCIIVAIIFTMVSYRQISLKNNRSPVKGAIVSIIAGVVISFFYPFIAKAMVANPDIPEAGKLTPYTALFFFSLSAVVTTLIYNYYFMRHPVEGKPIKFSAYFKGTTKDHVFGILGGMIWNLGMGLSIIAAGKASYAVAYGLSQGAVLVTAIWGVFVWKEFKGAPKKTNYFIAGMFVFYVFGLLFLIYSKFV